MLGRTKWFLGVPGFYRFYELEEVRVVGLFGSKVEVSRALGFKGFVFLGSKGQRVREQSRFCIFFIFGIIRCRGGKLETKVDGV